MRQDLDSVKLEIEQALVEMGVTVFRGRCRADEPLPMAIFWDSGQYPEPRAFLATAVALGVKVVVFHHRVFSEELVDEAFERLEVAEIERDDRREYERTLRRLKGFVGFTAAVELSYDFDGNTYVYELSATWFEELLRVLDDIDDSFIPPDEAGNDSPLGGYFSQN